MGEHNCITAEDLLQILLDAKNNNTDLTKFRIAIDEDFDIKCYVRNLEMIIDECADNKELLFKN